MSQGPATIYDVASLARVSTSTVSLALNSPERVAPETRRRVLAAADDLAFVPKAEAVTRARRGVGRIGVMAPFRSYPSYYRRLNGVLAAFGDGRGSVETVLFDHASAALAGSPLLSSLPLTRRLDGLIVMGLPLDDEVADRLLQHGVPTVLVDSRRTEFTCVVTDEVGGGRMAAGLLANLGHRHIGWLHETKRASTIELQGEARLRGFLEGLPADTRVTELDTAYDLDAARAAAQRLFTGNDPPTAVVGHNDLLAAGALQAARALGRHVAVVGFDGSELAAALDLTTLAQPFEESGVMAARVMTQAIAGQAPPVHVSTLSLTLIERASTGPVLAGRVDGP